MTEIRREIGKYTFQKGITSNNDGKPINLQEKSEIATCCELPKSHQDCTPRLTATHVVWAYSPVFGWSWTFHRSFHRFAKGIAEYVSKVRRILPDYNLTGRSFGGKKNGGTKPQHPPILGAGFGCLTETKWKNVVWRLCHLFKDPGQKWSFNQGEQKGNNVIHGFSQPLQTPICWFRVWFWLKTSQHFPQLCLKTDGVYCQAKVQQLHGLSQLLDDSWDLRWMENWRVGDMSKGAHHLEYSVPLKRGPPFLLLGLFRLEGHEQAHIFWKDPHGCSFKSLLDFLVASGKSYNKWIVFSVKRCLDKAKKLVIPHRGHFIWR